MYAVWLLETLLFSTLLCKGYLTVAQRTLTCVWRQMRQPVTAGKHPPPHLLTVDNADPGGNTQTVCVPNQLHTHKGFTASLVIISLS